MALGWQLIDQAPHIVPRDEYIKVPQEGGLLVSYHGRPMLPAIAIPTRSKTDFECPREHRERLMALIPQIDRLLIIGWRSTEQHFLRLWHGRSHPQLRAWVVNENQEAAQQAAVEFSRGAQVALNRIAGANVEGFSRLVDRDRAGTGEWILREVLS